MYSKLKFVLEGNLRSGQKIRVVVVQKNKKNFEAPVGNFRTARTFAPASVETLFRIDDVERVFKKCWKKVSKKV